MTFQYNRQSIAKIRLHARTMPVSTIAMIMRAPVSTIETICRRHDIEFGRNDAAPVSCEARNRSNGRTSRKLEVELEHDAYVLLNREADRRGINVQNIARKVIEVVAKEQLFRALLETDR